jgi:hypothetical protein
MKQQPRQPGLFGRLDPSVWFAASQTLLSPGGNIGQAGMNALSQHQYLRDRQEQDEEQRASEKLMEEQLRLQEQLQTAEQERLAQLRSYGVEQGVVDPNLADYYQADDILGMFGGGGYTDPYLLEGTWVQRGPDGKVVSTGVSAGGAGVATGWSEPFSNNGRWWQRNLEDNALRDIGADPSVLQFSSEQRSRLTQVPNLLASVDALDTLLEGGASLTGNARPGYQFGDFRNRAATTIEGMFGNLPGIGEGMRDMAAEISTDSRKALRQQSMTYAQTALAIMSGMQVTPTEARRTVEASLPEPGDSPTIARLKSEHRRQLVAQLDAARRGEPFDEAEMRNLTNNLGQQLLAAERGEDVDGPPGNLYPPLPR